jgi:hypothetical protein
MKLKNYVLLSLLLVFVILCSGSVLAVELTPRALGMGGAFTAVANDLSSVIYNPAGLNQSGLLGFQLNMGLMTDDLGKMNELFNMQEEIEENPLDVDFIDGASLDTQLLLGANLKSYSLAADMNTRFETTIEGLMNKLDITNSTEGIISFGSELTSPPFELGALSYGINLKLLRTDIVDIDFSDANMWKSTAAGSGFGVDAGILAKFSDILTVGAQIKNILANEYTVSGETVLSEMHIDEWVEVGTSSYTDTITPERVMRAGFALQVPVINATLAADIDNLPIFTNNNKEEVIHIGIEKNLFFNGLSLRAGTFNENGMVNYTFGLGLNLALFHLDAAVAMDEEVDDSFRGALAAGFKF